MSAAFLCYFRTCMNGATPVKRCVYPFINYCSIINYTHVFEICILYYPYSMHYNTE